MSDANLMKKLLLTVLLLSLMTWFGGGLLAAVATFTHIDDNPNSPRRTQSVGPYDGTNSGKVTMWYHQYNRY
jgi:hypothetical protein